METTKVVAGWYEVKPESETMVKRHTAYGDSYEQEIEKYEIIQNDEDDLWTVKAHYKVEDEDWTEREWCGEHRTKRDAKRAIKNSLEGR